MHIWTILKVELITIYSYMNRLLSIIMEETKKSTDFKWKRKYTLVKDLIGSDGGVRLIGTTVQLCGQVH